MHWFICNECIDLSTITRLNLLLYSEIQWFNACNNSLLKVQWKYSENGDTCKTCSFYIGNICSVDVEEQKCACNQCTFRWSKCEKCPDCNDSDHKYSWNLGNCDKVIRQTLTQRPYRTCRFCQKNIPTDQFEKVEFVYNNSYDISLHLKPCSQKLDVKNLNPIPWNSSEC